MNVSNYIVLQTANVMLKFAIAGTEMLLYPLQNQQYMIFETDVELVKSLNLRPGLLPLHRLLFG